MFYILQNAKYHSTKNETEGKRQELEEKKDRPTDGQLTANCRT